MDFKFLGVKGMSSITGNMSVIFRDGRFCPILPRSDFVLINHEKQTIMSLQEDLSDSELVQAIDGQMT
jgi:hypothetical protein